MYMNLIGLAIAMAKEGCQGICRYGCCEEHECSSFSRSNAIGAWSSCTVPVCDSRVSALAFGTKMLVTRLQCTIPKGYEQGLG